MKGISVALVADTLSSIQKKSGIVERTIAIAIYWRSVQHADGDSTIPTGTM
ncbi:MAG: hypothetical protein WC406_08475 [Methanoregula sp.]|jgi:hypothetical protein|nr:hypothetical protein [Methanoregula sp.]